MKKYEDVEKKMAPYKETILEAQRCMREMNPEIQKLKNIREDLIIQRDIVSRMIEVQEERKRPIPVEMRESKIKLSIVINDISGRIEESNNETENEVI